MMASRLRNWRDVWDAYVADQMPPPLVFRSGHTLFHEPGDAPVFLFFEVFANGCYRRCVPLPSRGAVVDIGANIGAFVLDCALGRSQVTVDAYEPNPRVFRTLQRNVDANGLGGRVRLFNEAVSAREGALRLWSAGATLAVSAFAPLADRSTAVDVRSVALSTVVERAGTVALLKIDAEGAEGEILSDARSLASVEAVVGEYHEHLLPGSLARVRAGLTAAGFAPHVIRDRRCGPLFYAHRR
jgi:FkbM family methyltransferase